MAKGRSKKKAALYASVPVGLGAFFFSGKLNASPNTRVLGAVPSAAIFGGLAAGIAALVQHYSGWDAATVGLVTAATIPVTMALYVGPAGVLDSAAHYASVPGFALSPSPGPLDV